jgi:hypothetical protein
MDVNKSRGDDTPVCKFNLGVTRNIRINPNLDDFPIAFPKVGVPKNGIGFIHRIDVSSAKNF